MSDKIQSYIDNNNNSNIIMKQVNEEKTLGFCLNEAIKLSNGCIISKFDDDDFYGKNYLTDMRFSMIISDADLVGKCAHMVYTLETKELWIKFYKSNFENKTSWMCGASLFFKKYIYNEYKFKESNAGEDTDFITKIRDSDFKMYASDFFNYCTIRDKKENHTYKCDLNEYFGKNSIMIKKYDEFPKHLVEN